MKYNVIVPEQYFYDMDEDDVNDFHGDLRHAKRRVDCVIEEIEEESE